MRRPDPAAAWLKAEGKAARRLAAPVIGAGLADIALAAAQAGCIAVILARVLAPGDFFIATRFLPAMSLPAIWPLAGFALLAVLRAGLRFAAEMAASRAGIAGRRRLRDGAMARLLAAGPAVLRARPSGDLAAAAIDRTEAMEGFFARWLAASFLAIAGPALIAGVAALVDPRAAIGLILAGLLVPLGMALAGIGAARAARQQFLAMTRLQARFLDRIRGIATLVLYGRTEDEAVRLAGAADELRRRTLRVLRVAFLSSTVLDLAMVIALVGFALHYAGARHAGGEGTLAEPGRALFLLLLVPEFFAPLRAFAAAYQDRLQAHTSAGALAGLPRAVAPVPPEARPHEIRTVAASGVSVAFENVHFTWDAARGPTLDGVSFRVAAGETLVLAGASGAGKSTVIEMLLGFIHPDQGRVTINGANIASIVPDALNRLIAWIGQRPMLFAGTLAENIRFARPEASDAEVMMAARDARVDQFAAQLPQGIETVVGDGGYGLSGGQAQRVAIARAYLRNAPLLLLDEPTAHLDPATEAEVLDSLRRLALRRTVIIASHSAAAHALGGRRLDLRQGRVVPAAARGAA